MWIITLIPINSKNGADFCIYDLNENMLIFKIKKGEKEWTKIAFDLNHTVLDGGLMNFGTWFSKYFEYMILPGI